MCGTPKPLELDELGARAAVLCACVALNERTCCKSAILKAWEDGDYQTAKLSGHAEKLEEVRLRFGPGWLEHFLAEDP